MDSFIKYEHEKEKENDNDIIMPMINELSMNECFNEIKRLCKVSPECDGLQLVCATSGERFLILTPYGLLVQYKTRNIFLMPWSKQDQQLLIPINSIEEQGTDDRDKIYIMRCLLCGNIDHDRDIIEKFAHIADNIIVRPKDIKNPQLDPTKNVYLKLKISFGSPTEEARNKYNIVAFATLHGGNETSKLKLIGVYWI